MSTIDRTENVRRTRQTELNKHSAKNRADAEKRHGQVWTTPELDLEFTVLGFAAPYVIVERKSDGKRGSLEFQHEPRFYFKWRPE